MNRIQSRFQELAERGETAFIPYITAGDPSLDATVEIVLALDRAGADCVELGIPFSDPVGDGIAIQEAAQRALARGVTPKDVIAAAKRVRAQSQVPLLLFTYYNPVLAYGVERFAQNAAEAGADGVLCVDLPPEEAGEYKAALDSAGLCTVFLTAPTTTDQRLRAIAEQCTGFVYYVSRLGVTGERSELQANLDAAVARIKKHTAMPVAVGFGISTPEQARKVAGMAEGVVVGSALVRLIAEKSGSPRLSEEVYAFTHALVEATKGAAVKTAQV